MWAWTSVARIMRCSRLPRRPPATGRAETQLEILSSMKRSVLACMGRQLGFDVDALVRDWPLETTKKPASVEDLALDAERFVGGQTGLDVEGLAGELEASVPAASRTTVRC